MIVLLLSVLVAGCDGGKVVVLNDTFDDLDRAGGFNLEYSASYRPAVGRFEVEREVSLGSLAVSGWIDTTRVWDPVYVDGRTDFTIEIFEGSPMGDIATASLARKTITMEAEPVEATGDYYGYGGPLHVYRSTEDLDIHLGEGVYWLSVWSTQRTFWWSVERGGIDQEEGSGGANMHQDGLWYPLVSGVPAWQSRGLSFLLMGKED